MLNSFFIRNGHLDQHALIPKELLTGTGANPKPRLRVDPGQTSFFEGREFRAYFEFLSIAAGQSVSFRFTAPIDFILQKQAVSLRTGDLRFEVYSAISPIDGSATPITPAGTWNPLSTVLGKNRMSERPLYGAAPYVRQCTIETGGTFTGGSQVDLVLLAAQNIGNQVQTVGATDDDSRGLPATTFYGRATNVAGAAAALTGVYYLEWEERQAGATY